MKNRYTFEIPTSGEIKEEDKILVQIVYKATKLNNFSIGLSCTIKLFQNDSDHTGESRTSATSHMGYDFEMPIIIQ